MGSSPSLTRGTQCRAKENTDCSNFAYGGSTGQSRPPFPLGPRTNYFVIVEKQIRLRSHYHPDGSKQVYLHLSTAEE